MTPHALRIAPLALVLAAVAPLPARAGDGPPLYSFPEPPSQPLPNFYPERPKPAGATGDAKKSQPLPSFYPERGRPAGASKAEESELRWYASGAIGFELVAWTIEDGAGAFPRYRTGSAPSHGSLWKTSTYGYADVPDGTFPVYGALQGGLQLSKSWQLGLQYGYSRTSGPEIAVSHHAFEVGATIHPFQPWVFVRAALGRDLLVFSDDAGASVYSRFTWAWGLGGTIRLPGRLAFPLALESTQTFEPEDGGVPTWGGLRFTAGAVFR